MEPTPTPRIKCISISGTKKKQEPTKQEPTPTPRIKCISINDPLATKITWNEVNRSYLTTQKKTRKRVLKYDTTYCFNLSKSQLTALTEYAKFNNVSISKSIRNAITEMMNKGRI